MLFFLLLILRLTKNNTNEKNNYLPFVFLIQNFIYVITYCVIVNFGQGKKIQIEKLFSLSTNMNKKIK